MLKKVLSIFILVLIGNLSNAQQQVGTWYFYGAFYEMQYHEKVGNLLYSGNDKGSFFQFDISTSELTTLSKINDFTDSRVTYLKYSESHNTLIIAYANGQIDLLSGNQITNINDIFRNESISSSKRINNIIINGDQAYLSTDFGVVVLNLKTNLINDTYRFIGENGDELQVLSTTINTVNDSIYICTEDRVQAANLNNINLNDFNNWTAYESSSGVPDDSIVGIVIDQDVVYLAADQNIYELSGGNWNVTQSHANPISGIKQGNDNFCLGTGDSVFVKSGTWSSFQSSNYTATTDVSFDAEENQLLVSDYRNGVLINGERKNYNTPLTTNAEEIVNVKNEMILLPGESKEDLYQYQEYIWTNYLSADLLGFSDFVDADYSTLTQKYYYGSFGNGLLQKDAEGNFSQTGQNFLNAASDGNVYVSAVETDRDGNTWVANYTTNSNDFSSSLFKITDEDNWEAFVIPSTQGRSIRDIKFNSSGYAFLMTNSGNLLAYDPEEGLLKTFSSNTTTIRGRITSMDMTYDDNLVLGTTDGISVGFNTRSVFSNDQFAFTTPIFGTGFLLSGESVADIVLDGGDNLWAATNSGIQCFNKSFDERLLFFSNTNSPLLTNEINQIGINGDNGEVFINTSNGLFSYQGFATEATDQNKDNITIFPNPVLPSFEGVVTIKGLAYGVNVKFTDIAGNLVFETDSEGGSSVWDLQLRSGDRASTGVYLIFTTDSEGNETFVGKLAIVSE